jgi:hypothetical protein
MTMRRLMTFVAAGAAALALGTGVASAHSLTLKMAGKRYLATSADTAWNLSNPAYRWYGSAVFVCVEQNTCQWTFTLGVGSPLGFGEFNMLAPKPRDGSRGTVTGDVVDYDNVNFAHDYYHLKGKVRVHFLSAKRFEATFNLRY